MLFKLIFSLLLLTGCSTLPVGYLGHSTNTQVILNQANYKIIETIDGSASATNIMGIGMSFGTLYAKAKQNMINSVRNEYFGKSIAIINITSEQKYNYFYPYLPLYTSKTVTVSADLIEFIDK